MGYNNNINYDRKEFRLWNDKMAELYNPDNYHKRSSFFIRIIESWRVKTIVKLLDVDYDDTVLEIGCGAGNLMEAFNHGWILGVDLSYPLLNIANNKNYQTKHNLLQGYGEILPFRIKAFDKIYCSEVLEHVPEPKTICREAHRLLKKKGIFVISVPNEKVINSIKTLMHLLFIDKIINFISKYKFSKDMTDEWHLHNFDLDYLQNTVQDLFIIEKIKYIPSKIFPVRIVISCTKKDAL